MQPARTVFMVDDDIDDQEIFSTAMERADQSVNCVFADDGIAALKKLNEETSFIPDLIFIDLNMPRMNGEECLSNIKKIDRLKDVPVYIYSTSAEQAELAASKQPGVVDFLVKPADINDLAAVLRQILKSKLLFICMAFCFFMGISPKAAAQKKNLHTLQKLKKLSVEQLMNIEVTSVSRSPQKLTEVASAIQVLTGEDIRRSPTTLLPEVLRLAPNLQVARAGSHEWSVSSRGFNGAAIPNSSLANKLLVLIDGRTVYNPLFGGVYWDVQSMLKESIDRIEVVSGPGGTVWGANAVNGVINVISKSAKETEGLSISGSYGSYLRDGFAVKYGSHIDTSFFFRVSAQHFDFESSNYQDSSDARDQWNMTRGAFRADYYPSAKNHFTLQGDIYTGNEDLGDSTQVNGGNVLGRWTHVFSATSDLSIQAYWDRTWRKIRRSLFRDEINTFDIDIQHHFIPVKRNRLTWGVGYRVLRDATLSYPADVFNPAARTLDLFTAFAQDQLTLAPDRLELTAGAKWQHNDYTGAEWQPSVRLAWTPTPTQTIWTAVSRAVRTPSRYDADITSFRLVNHPAFKSEKVIAYELGYRIHPVESVSLSFAAYYNTYKDLRSVDVTGNTAAPSIFANNLKATSYGFEFSGNYVVTDWWRLRGGYSYVHKNFTRTSAATLEGTEGIEAVDPANQAILQSIMDLPKNFELDLLGRFVGKLDAQALIQAPEIPAYFSLDLKLNWEYKFFSPGISIQNITDARHVEYGNREIPRSIHVKIGFRF